MRSWWGAAVDEVFDGGEASGWRADFSWVVVSITADSES